VASLHGKIHHALFVVEYPETDNFPLNHSTSSPLSASSIPRRITRPRPIAPCVGR